MLVFGQLAPHAAEDAVAGAGQKRGGLVGGAGAGGRGFGGRERGEDEFGGGHVVVDVVEERGLPWCGGQGEVGGGLGGHFGGGGELRGEGVQAEGGSRSYGDGF